MTASDHVRSVMDNARRVASAPRVRLSAYTTLEMPQKRGSKHFDARTKSFGRRFVRLRIQSFPLWHTAMVASVDRLEVHCVFLLLSLRQMSFCHVERLDQAKTLTTAKSLRRCSERCIKEMILRASSYWHAFVQVSERKISSARIRTRHIRGT